MFKDFILPGVSRLALWLLVSVGILIQGISKSGFAGGAGVLSLPLLMLVMPVQKVTAMLLPLLILCDMKAIYGYRDYKDWPVIRAVYIPSIAGIILGAGLVVKQTGRRAAIRPVPQGVRRRHGDPVCPAHLGSRGRQ